MTNFDHKTVDLYNLFKDQAFEIDLFRNKELEDDVKELYQYNCQFCCINMEDVADLGLDSQEQFKIAHLWDLKFSGPAEMTNMLCLCAECEMSFAVGRFIVQKEGSKFKWFSYYPDEMDWFEGGLVALQDTHKLSEECVLWHSTYNKKRTSDIREKGLESWNQQVEDQCLTHANQELKKVFPDHVSSRIKHDQTDYGSFYPYKFTHCVNFVQRPETLVSQFFDGTTVDYSMSWHGCSQVSEFNFM